MVSTLPIDLCGKFSGHAAPGAFPAPAQPAGPAGWKKLCRHGGEQAGRRTGKPEGQRTPSHPTTTFSKYAAQACARAALAPASDPAAALKMGPPDLPPAGGDGHAQWPSGLTTVMLRNLPNRYTPEELVDEFIQAGFHGCFDFLYVPIDFKRKGNLGYGFLNLRSPYIARLFRHAFDGQSLPKYVTNKVLAIAPAVTQGFGALVNKWFKEQARRVENPWYRPIIFLPGNGAPWQWMSLCEASLPDIALYLTRLIDASAAPNEDLHEDEDAEVGVLSDAEAASVIQADVARFLSGCEGPDLVWRCWN